MIFLKFYLTYPDRAALEAAVDDLGNHSGNDLSNLKEQEGE